MRRAKSSRRDPARSRAAYHRGCVWVSLPVAGPGGAAIFTFAHLSDLHATPVAPRGLGVLASKRLLGWLSWRLRRSRAHRPEVLEALLGDLRETRPDQVVITGDLTNISLPSEFPLALAWLRRIGSPDRVSAVPGNHDAYVCVPREISWDLWSDYLLSDPASEAGGTAQLRFPSLRVRGPLAIVGLNSAVPTGPFIASGALGSEQLERLERLLAELARGEHFRLLLIHHPPLRGEESRRRSLDDAEALAAVLSRTGVDLVVHGHLHRTRISSLPGPAGPIPVVGVRSASDRGSKPDKRAHYHLFRLHEQSGEGDRPRYRIELCTRAFGDGGFSESSVRSL